MRKTLLLIILLQMCTGAYAKMTISSITLDGTMMSRDGELNLDEAEENLWERIDEEPYNSENYGKLALYYDYIGDHENQLEALKRQVDYLPEDYEKKDIPYGNLARAFMLNGKWLEGKKWIDKADAININNSYNRWNAFSYYTDYDFNAKEAARQLSILDNMSEPQDDVFYDGYMLYKDTDGMTVDRMVEIFEAAVEQNLKNHKALRNLAGVLRFKAMDNPALFDRIYKLLDQALSIEPNFMPTYLTKANALYMEYANDDIQKAIKKALQWTAKARQIEPDNPKIDYMEGNYFLGVEEYEKALVSFERALDKGFDLEQVKNELVTSYNGAAYKIYESGKDLERGLEYVDKAIELLPENGVVLSTKAEVLYKMKRYEEAYQFITRGIELRPDNEEIRSDYVMIYEALFPGKEVELPAIAKPNDKVRAVEGRLSELGYNLGVADGIIDSIFREAIESFQLKNDLEPTKFVDQATLDKLNL